jgi:organic radical activating enzyme
MSERRYKVNEIYRTIHGEGVRYGIPHVFVRFSLCNLTCNFCDTEYESGTDLTAEQIVDQCNKLAAVTPNGDGVQVPEARRTPDNGPTRGPIRDVLLCGGEPLLQADVGLVDQFHQGGWFVACETNGTVDPVASIDWITCSPKVAEHAIKLSRVDELKYVRGVGQAIPRPKLAAKHYLISPLFSASHTNEETIQWCIKLVLDNPQWRLTVQHHKMAFANLR